MRCEECQSLIEELVDNELDEQKSTLVRAHINSCHDCADLCNELGREQQVYGHYQRNIEISPAMWTSVLSRIEKETPRPTRPIQSLRSRIESWFVPILRTPLMSPALAAAVVIIAVGLTVVVMKYTAKSGGGDEKVAVKTAPSPAATPSPSQGPTVVPEQQKSSNPTIIQKPTPPAPKERRKQAGEPSSQELALNAARTNGQKAGSTPASTMTTEQAVRAAEQSYLAAIALLSRDIKRNQTQLDPAVQARFRETLASIDRTIDETRRAVRQHPGDAIAAQYLLAAYQDKVEVLKEVASNQ